MAKAQYLNAHVRSNARAAQVEVLRKECERLRKLHARAIELGRAQLERTFQKWMGASLTNSFHGWHEAAKLEAKAAKEFEMARQLEALKLELETQRKELEAAHAAEVRRLKRKLSDVGGTQREIDRLRGAAIKSAVNRMRMAAAAAAFEKWTERWRKTKKAKYVIRKIVLSRAGRAMEAWKNLAGEKVRLRAKMRQVAGRIFYRRLANAWDKWADRKDEVARNRLKVQRMLSKMKNKELEASFGRCVFFLSLLFPKLLTPPCIHLSLSHPFRWCDAVSDLKEYRARLKRIISRARHQGILPAWSRWIDNMCKLQRLRDQLQRVIARARSQGVSAGFQRWLEAVKEAKSLRSRATRALSRFRNRHLSQAWSRWQGLFHVLFIPLSLVLLDFNHLKNKINQSPSCRTLPALVAAMVFHLF